MFPSDLRSVNHVGVGTRIAGVVQGYKPQVDWGGDSGSATIVVGGHNVRVATEGWRRRCLYILLTALLLLSLVNLSLTLWIFKTVDFSVDGMGPLHVVVAGVEMEGMTEFLGKMSATEIQSRKDTSLSVQGYYNLSVTTASDTPEGKMANFLHINTEGVLAGGRSLKVRSLKGRHLLLDASKNHSYIGAETLTVTGERGATFHGSVETPCLVSSSHLRLQSVTREVKVRGAKEVRVEARSGDVAVAALGNVTLGVKQGPLRLDNPDIYFTLLTVADKPTHTHGHQDSVTPHPQETQIPAPETERRGGGGVPPPPTTPLPSSSPPPTKKKEEVQVFQVCVCPTGRLFLAPAHQTCVFEEGVCR